MNKCKCKTIILCYRQHIILTLHDSNNFLNAYYMGNACLEKVAKATFLWV